jgi:hypothetical protein
LNTLISIPEWRIHIPGTDDETFVNFSNIGHNERALENPFYSNSPP